MAVFCVMFRWPAATLWIERTEKRQIRLPLMVISLIYEVMFY